MWPMGEKKVHDGTDSENFTFLGKGVDFKGVVNFDGTVRIDGRLEGEVHTTGTLIVGDQAIIKGTISAGILLTSGKINGTVTATDRVQILKHGILIGDIRTPSISIEDGAHFHGMCDMGAHKWVDEGAATTNTNKHVHDLAAHRGKIRNVDL
jgi:cytoskeletal protein CcmA (bactofilin family)